MHPERTPGILIVTFSFLTAASACTDEPKGKVASDPVPTDQVAASRQARVKYKSGARYANDLAAALDLPREAVCRELGRYDCVDEVHWLGFSATRLLLWGDHRGPEALAAIPPRESGHPRGTEPRLDQPGTHPAQHPSRPPVALWSCVRRKLAPRDVGASPRQPSAGLGGPRPHHQIDDLPGERGVSTGRSRARQLSGWSAGSSRLSRVRA